MNSLLKFAVFLIVVMLLVSQGKCRSFPVPQNNGLLGGRIDPDILDDFLGGEQLPRRLRDFLNSDVPDDV
ncbi:hypothetical protein J6590_047315 [Homalodisca vitripennis]|nr:hypothetical protein J6590_047315 [Homalodisca vitripennis]